VHKYAHTHKCNAHTLSLTHIQTKNVGGRRESNSILICGRHERSFGFGALFFGATTKRKNEPSTVNVYS
jgi:hypothetical protein